MALPASGEITMAQVNTELGNSSTTLISLNDSVVRTLFGVSSGAISLDDGHGKSSNPGRGLFAGGSTGTYSSINTIDYITIASTGNATDFGDLTVTRRQNAGCGSSTRGVFAGGNASNVYHNTIDYITIASTGNATDFGDSSVTRANMGACSSPTRGVFAGGEQYQGGFFTTSYAVIDYITIASTGNATNFGNLTVTRYGATGCSSSTRGVFAGGALQHNVIDYITIASTGNATDFGDLTVGRFYAGGASTETKATFGGGYPYAWASGFSSTSVIDYITIASTGNATNFGNLTVSRGGVAGCSSAHGGI